MSLVGKGLDLVCCSSIAGYCNSLLGGRESTDGKFVPCITKPYGSWGKDGLQQGLAAGGCPGKYACALSLIPAGLLGLLLLEQSLELS